MYRPVCPLILFFFVCSVAAAPPPPPLRQKPQAAAPAAGIATVKKAAAVTPAPPDTVLATAIRARFQRSKIRTEGFTVAVAGGVATIEGRTKVIQRKGTATRLARLAGAKSVVNRIQVDEEALERAARNLEKGRKKRARSER